MGGKQPASDESARTKIGLRRSLRQEPARATVGGADQWARRRRRRRAPHRGRWRRSRTTTGQQGRVSGRGAKQGDTAGDGRRREMCPQQRFLAQRRGCSRP
eukprot:6237963-Prymnesium_polylepis.1